MIGTEIKLVRQAPYTLCCGQAIVATLLGITLEESVARFGHDGVTKEEEIRAALGFSGWRLGDRHPHTKWLHEPGTFPERSDGDLALGWLFSPVGKDETWHWVLLDGHDIYCPVHGKLENTGKYKLTWSADITKRESS
jgi:hypothetical protein